MSTLLTLFGPPVPIAVEDRARIADRDAAEAAPAPMFDLIELFFFAYRDFVGDADRRLADLAFGRAHHRVLHFVMREPGLTIAELLDILRITKQSLNRVMKDLVDAGCIETRTGVADRRHRLLFATSKGRRLALDLAGVQSRRFERVLDELPQGAREGAVAFFLAMIDGPDGDAMRSRFRQGAAERQAS